MHKLTKRQLKFDKEKFKRISGWTSSGLIAWFSGLAFLMGILAILTSGKLATSANMFPPSSGGDWLFLTLWLISGLVPMGYLGLQIIKPSKLYVQKNNFWRFIAILMLTIFLLTVIPAVFNGQGKTAAAVAKTVTTTKAFCIGAYVISALGFGTTLIVTRKQLQKSNWWLLIIALPYMLLSWMAQRQQAALNQMLSVKGFSNASVAEMLQHMKHGQAALINQMWHTLITCLCAATLISMGVIVGEILWKKTKKWRQAGKKAA